MRIHISGPIFAVYMSRINPAALAYNVLIGVRNIEPIPESVNREPKADYDKWADIDRTLGEESPLKLKLLIGLLLGGDLPKWPEPRPLKCRIISPALVRVTGFSRSVRCYK